MYRRPPRVPRPDTSFPQTTLFRSRLAVGAKKVGVDPGLERLAVQFDRLWRRPRRIERNVGRHAVEAADGDLRFGRADQRARRNAAGIFAAPRVAKVDEIAVVICLESRQAEIVDQSQPAILLRPDPLGAN